MIYIKYITLFFISLLLIACSSSVSVDDLTFQGQKRQYSERLAYKIELSSVRVKDDFDSDWLSEVGQKNFYTALKKSLLAQGLLSDNGNFMLEVELIDVKQKQQSFDRQVITHINYKFIDTIANNTVFDEVIISSYTATFNDAITEGNRINYARQQAAQKNIKMLLDKLAAL